MNNTDLTEQWTAMQKMFLPTSTISAPLRENAQRFWENQEKVLDSMQALANAWFERRHTGAHKAGEAAERMCGTGTFVDLIQAYQDWAVGAFERIMADGLSCQQQILAVTGALASPPLAPSTTEKRVEPQPSESKARPAPRHDWCPEENYPPWSKADCDEWPTRCVCSYPESRHWDSSCAATPVLKGTGRGVVNND